MDSNALRRMTVSYAQKIIELEVRRESEIQKAELIHLCDAVILCMLIPFRFVLGMSIKIKWEKLSEDYWKRVDIANRLFLEKMVEMGEEIDRHLYS